MLREELLPQAPEEDAVGAERYAVRLRYYLGADLDEHDLRETYDWGVGEVERLLAEGAEVARQLGAGSLEEAVELLEHDPARLVHGAEAFRDWMQQVSDEAVAALGGSHFDVPEAVRTLALPDRPVEHRRRLLHAAVGGPEPQRRDVVVGAPRA